MPKGALVEAATILRRLRYEPAIVEADAVVDLE
jgi:hypothetical protein